MNRTLKIISMIAVIGTAPIAYAEDNIPRTIMAMDVSASVTFLFEQTSADAAGGYVENYIAGLKAPHSLQMVSIGDAGLGGQIINIRATVTDSRASSARKLAPQFGGYFRSLPGLVQSGKITPQSTTSLLSFFNSLEPVCAKGKATVIVFSDGIESSTRVDGTAFVAGKAALPKPEGTFLKGCEIRLLGVGQIKKGLNADALAERLIPKWRAFLTAAGADPITVIGMRFSF